MAKIGKYELVRRLAKGGMAEVFLAKAEWAGGIERTVVVKRILADLADEPAFVEMFLSEARLTSYLSHPNIVQIFDFGEAEGAYFLAMEYVDGPSLRMLAKRAHEAGTPLPFRVCAKIIGSACEALAYAHELTDPDTGVPLQIVHRDISPDNVLISCQGNVKVVDFGIAKAVIQSHRTKTGVVKGKLAYMAPEQLKSEPLDRRADVYALGVVLYELASGTIPYEAASEVSMIHAILYESPVPIRRRRPDIPEELERIIGKALAFERDKRYADCREMYTDIERYLLSCREPLGAFQIAQLIDELQAAPTKPPDSTVPSTSPKPSANRSQSEVQSAPAKPPEVAAPPAPAGTPADEPAIAEMESASAKPADPSAPSSRAEPNARVPERDSDTPADRARPPAECPPATDLPETRLQRTPAPRRITSAPRAPDIESPSPSRRSLVPFLAMGAGVLAVSGVAFLTFGSRATHPDGGAESRDATVVDGGMTSGGSVLPMPDAGTGGRSNTKREAGIGTSNLRLHDGSDRSGEVKLTVRSDPPVTIRLTFGNRVLTDSSPLTAEVPTGVVVIDVFDRSKGLSKREQIQVTGNKKAMEHVILVRKSTLLIDGPSWTQVAIDGRVQEGFVPHEAKVYEGTHAVQFTCPSGKADSQQVTVEGASVKVVSARCE